MFLETDCAIVGLYCNGSVVGDHGRKMMAKTKVLTAPFDERGNLLHYPLWEGNTRPEWQRHNDWRVNKPFWASMTLQNGVTSGRSAKYVNWDDAEGHSFPMFVSDLVDLVVRGEVANGVCEAWWMVAKRGRNYGLRLAKDDEVTYADRANAPLSDATILALKDKLASGDIPVRRLEFSGHRCEAYCGCGSV